MRNRVVCTLFIFACALQGGLACTTQSFSQAAACQNSLQTAFQQVGASFSYESLSTLCDLFVDVIACVDAALAPCSSMDAAQQMQAQMATMNSTYCNLEYFCIANVSDCMTDFPAIHSEPDFSDPDYCTGVLGFADCATAIDDSCSAMPNVTQYFGFVNQLRFTCQQSSCSGVQQCVNALDAVSNTRPGGLWYDLCMAYHTYTLCLNTNLPLCGGNGATSGQTPALGVVATYIHDTCTRLQAGDIYTCTPFTTCFDSFIEQVDALSPEMICHVVQSTVGCMASTAFLCGQTDLVTASNNCMLRMSNQACGLPNFDLGGCTGFTACRASLLASLPAPDSEQPAFCAACSAIQTFQTCANNTMGSCGLQPQATPSLSQLALLTGRVCTVISDESLCSCPDFVVCLGNDTFPQPSALLTTFHWCRVTLKVLKCARNYADACEISQAGVDTVTAIRADALSQGCMTLGTDSCTMLSSGGVRAALNWCSLLVFLVGALAML